MGAELERKRILLVEDEYFIASDLRRLLEQHGITVVGPVGGLEAGLVLAEEDLDAAVLDVNLEGAYSFPIADRLADRAIPFMFVTGYDDWALPACYRDIPRVAKPFAANFVVEMIRQICRKGPAA
jgi:DNA-binding response OmpR family regulator